ncbi:MAG: hypothetical protein GY820_12485 [Gammaproteobacteria bacterium]|nr:hypothetical protein [Gammaproteobacteria bacterium]
MNGRKKKSRDRFVAPSLNRSIATSYEWAFTRAFSLRGKDFCGVEKYRVIAP